MLGRKKKDIAASGELAAARFLDRQGFQVLATNWRSGRWGEIDLIVRNDKGLIVFVEVKTRRRENSFGFPSSGFDCLNRHKQQKILISARSYLARQKKPERSCRFDLIVIEYEREEDLHNQDYRNLQITHVAEAFTG